MYENLEKLIETVRILRSPQGCEWDRAQTHKSLKTNMLEEAYEAIDAIDSGDIANLREENPEATLEQLGAMLKNPIGKSSVSHRFKKIEEYL